MNFTYDNRNRIKTTTDVFNHLVEYGYDANSNRTQLKLDSAVHTNYAYDVVNRLTTLTDEANQNFTFGYDIANRLISKTLPNSITTTYNYDGMSRLTRLKHQSSTATLTDNNFGYNTANQINQIAELTQTKNFAYDNIDRLTSMNNGTADENYAFDGVGNRTSSSRSSTYNYQPFNRVTATQTANYNNDANGNMVSKSEGSNFWHYGWDYENRLVTASTRKQTVRYRYDALGRRVQRYFVRGGGENTKFIYDGLDVLMDDNSGVLTKYQNGLGIDDKLKMVTNGTAKYFLQDHLGSTVGLADASGNITSSASYDSFGNSTNNLSTRYQYTGREKDEFTGLHFYRARWYDANLGRFISEDPIGFVGGINLFGYVKNNPLFYKDPKGHNACVASWAFAGSVVGGVIGGGVGLVGVVGGGVAIVVTEPAGLALGAAAGGLAGAAIGSLLCDPIPYAQYPPSPTTSPKSEEKCDAKPKSNPSPNPVPVPFPLPTPSGNSGRWTCTAKCHVNNFSNIPNAPEFCYGQGMGASERDACQAAKDVAQASSPRGTYARHCRCTQCWQQ